MHLIHIEFLLQLFPPNVNLCCFCSNASLLGGEFFFPCHDFFKRVNTVSKAFTNAQQSGFAWNEHTVCITEKPTLLLAINYSSFSPGQPQDMVSYLLLRIESFNVLYCVWLFFLFNIVRFICFIFTSFVAWESIGIAILTQMLFTIFKKYEGQEV